MESCINCEKWKLKKKELLERCDSIFDIAEELRSFEETCQKTCINSKDINENS